MAIKLTPYGEMIHRRAKLINKVKDSGEHLTEAEYLELGKLVISIMLESERLDKIREEKIRKAKNLIDSVGGSYCDYCEAGVRSGKMCMCTEDQVDCDGEEYFAPDERKLKRLKKGKRNES